MQYKYFFSDVVSLKTNVAVAHVVNKFRCHIIQMKILRKIAVCESLSKRREYGFCEKFSRENLQIGRYLKI